MDPIAAVKSLIEQAGTQAQAAKRLGITQQYLSDILHGRRNISASLACKLGYTRTVSYAPKAPRKTA